MLRVDAVVGAAPTVAGLTRYPVKSMSGEKLDELTFDERGVVGDRRWSVRTMDGKIGSGKNTRRFAALPRPAALLCSPQQWRRPREAP